MKTEKVGQFLQIAAVLVAGSAYADDDSVTEDEVVDLGVVQQIDRSKLPKLPIATVEEQLGLNRLPGWKVTEIDRWLSNEGSVALVAQSFNEMEVAGATMTVELDKAGAIIRINHAWLPQLTPTCEFRSELAQERALSEWGVEDLQAVYWPRLGGHMECAYRYKDEMYTHVVSADGVVLQDSSSLLHYDPATADVRARTYDGTGSFPSNGNSIFRMNIGKEGVWLSSDCRFVLADPAGPHTLSRVMDDNGLEYEFVGPCGSVPGFVDTNGDSLREATHFLVTQRTRNSIGGTMWTHNSPARSADVQITFDLGDPYCNACFNTVTTDIYLHSIENSQPFWHSTIHEYGHYISWSYGGSSGSCEHDVNEGGSIEEAMGDVVRMAYMRRYEGTDYSDPFSLQLPRSTNTSVQEPHTNVQYVDRCSAGGSTAIYNQSGPFSQAMWEVMNSTNQGVSPAVTLTSVNVTEVLEALSDTLNALGPDMTYEQFITRMSLHFATGTVRTGFLNVFRHHGFNV